jgi:hypothetical protein
MVLVNWVSILGFRWKASLRTNMINLLRSW